MKLPNGLGGVVYLGKKRRKPFGARITIGWSKDKKQQYKYLGYFKTRKEALTCLIEFNKNPYDIDTKKMTLLEIYEDWSSHHFEKITEGSQRVYKVAFKKMEKLYHIPISDLRAYHFQNLINAHKENYTSTKMIKILAGLLFHHGMKYGIVEKDYSDLLELPKKETKNKKQALSKNEVNLILNNEISKRNDMLIVLLYTGMRIAELFELESKNIDLENRIMIGGKKGINGTNRRIPIHCEIIPIIKRNIGQKYLFTSPRGKLYLYSNEGIALNRYLKKLGIDKTCHELRHTFVSQCQRLNINNVTLKRIIGHSTRDITEHYTHKTDEDLIKAIDEFFY